MFLCRGVWIPQGTRLSGGCDGCVFGGVIVVGVFGTVCVVLVGSSSEGIVSYLVGACCFPYAGLGWRCGPWRREDFVVASGTPVPRNVGSAASVLWPIYSVLSAMYE